MNCVMLSARALAASRTSSRMPARSRTSHGWDAAPKISLDVRTVPALGSTTAGPTPRRVGHIPSSLCDVLGGSWLPASSAPRSPLYQDCTRCAAYRVQDEAMARLPSPAPERAAASGPEGGTPSKVEENNRTGAMCTCTRKAVTCCYIRLKGDQCNCRRVTNRVDRQHHP